LLTDDTCIREIAVTDEQRCEHQQRETLAVEVTRVLEPREGRARRAFGCDQSFLP
jgi:hypothetical protein